MSSPYFSIVIPTYNRGQLLAERLQLIFKQSFTDFEIIVVDDGSTEDIGTLLRTKFSDEKRLNCLRQKNSERGAARNLGFSNAKGSYVVFFDSDDLMHENHLATLKEYIVKSDFPPFLATWFDFVDEKNSKHNSDIIGVTEGYYDYKLFLNGNPLACNVCVKKDNPLYRPFVEDRNLSIKEDWIFFMMNLIDQKIYIIPVITISMYDHSGRSMRSDNQIIIERTHRAVNLLNASLPLTDDDKKKLIAHENYFCGIHSYLDQKRKQSISYSLKALLSGGIKSKYISLLLKSIVGRGFISKLKGA